jgi:O-antigen ligase
MAVFDEGMGLSRLRRVYSLWPFVLATGLGLLIVRLPLLPAVALLAPVVLLAMFVEPLVGVALMLLTAPWGALENVALGRMLLDSGQLLFLLTVGAWLVRSALAGRVTLRPMRFTLPLLLFVAVSSFTLIDAPSIPAGLTELLKWVEVGVVALVVVDRVAILSRKQTAIASWIAWPEDSWRVLLFIILLGGFTQAIIGIWQFGLRGSGPEHFQIVGGRFFRAYGTFEQPNPFGGFMAWIACVGLGATLGTTMQWLFARRSRSRQPLRWLILLATMTLAAFLALLFSWSRGAWLGFGSGVAALLLLWPRRRFTGLVALLAVLVLAGAIWQSGLLPPAMAERVVSFTEDLQLGDVRGADINDANYAVLERLAHWQAALNMARYNLWSGVGFGNYEAAYANYALINWPAPLGHAHNYYLNLLAETGVPGFLAYALFWFVVVWQTLSVISRSEWPERGAALGLLAAWVALSVHQLLDKLYVNNLYLYLGAMLGVLQVLYERTCRKA